MKPASLLLLTTPTALAAINGRCTHLVGSEIDETWGICITRSECDRYGGDSSWVGLCPYDGNNVRCCFVNDCDKKYSACAWTNRDQCPLDRGASFVSNKCPGGSNFKCCNF